MDTAFGLNLAEYHTGYRAFRREGLEHVNLEVNSDAFICDQEIMAQIVQIKMRIGEVPVPTRYFAQASSASFGQSSGWLRQRPFESLGRRYSTAPQRPSGQAPVKR